MEENKQTKGAGLTTLLQKQQKLYIGDSIVLWIQKNTSVNCKRYPVRIVAPRHIQIGTDEYFNRIESKHKKHCEKAKGLTLQEIYERYGYCEVGDEFGHEFFVEYVGVQLSILLDKDGNERCAQSNKPYWKVLKED